MQYALLIYRPADLPVNGTDDIPAATAAILERPNVLGWARLHAPESATTVGRRDGSTLITDGPFIESKEFLVGVILIEADSLDAALEMADALEELRPAGAIEVRPLRGIRLGGPGGG